MGPLFMQSLHAVLRRGTSTILVVSAGFELPRGNNVSELENLYDPQWP
ncbi:hypothetical protein WG66_001214 [Moniliophthora roreri]|nr:hypothetical protein WG66_001214 [Moniliophthora roreri]